MLCHNKPVPEKTMLYHSLLVQVGTMFYHSSVWKSELKKVEFRKNDFLSTLLQAIQHHNIQYNDHDI
jgi:hypothetical protein